MTIGGRIRRLPVGNPAILCLARGILVCRKKEDYGVLVSPRAPTMANHIVATAWQILWIAMKGPRRHPATWRAEPREFERCMIFLTRLEEPDRLSFIHKGRKQVNDQQGRER